MFSDTSLFSRDFQVLYIYIYIWNSTPKRSNAVLHSLAQVLKYDCLGSNSNIILSKLLNLSGSHFSYL